ncbi:cutinase family protein [Candidatus Saccharibacteria bacterium]|nr:cutinase family protein [Candidatus Saccharibacteria bacterium]
MREKMKLKIMRIRRRKSRIRVRFLILAGLMVISGSGTLVVETVSAESCPDLKIIFARGSGGERWNDQNYLEFKARIEEKLPTAGLSYEFLDLDYPAVGVGADNLDVAIGAFFGAGDAYEFGNSVDAGVQELTKIVNYGCAKTKYVIGGYSQGAMVVSKALPNLNADRIIYAATFGDPKIYLPEGAGLVPAACAGRNLSDYRAYVPDCRAYKGLLGGYKPYQPEEFLGKLGTWCNKYDIFCSSYYSISSHTSYVADDLYEDASRVIASKVALAFSIDSEYASPHDTAILIDSTDSMGWLIGQFREEAVRLANETFAVGGRVALYDYRDLADPYEPVARCTFETCTAENFGEYLDSIVLEGGGDIPESMLSASLKVMNELSWRRGATKSLVVLTDAAFLSPDRDGTTMWDVIELSKRIDPVNLYIVTDETIAEMNPAMSELAEATGGMVVTDFGNLNILTERIMERYDSLPVVEEETGDLKPLPAIDDVQIYENGDGIKIDFKNTGTKAIVILNDAILGITEEQSITLTNLNHGVTNELVLVPVDDSRRGERAVINISVEATSDIVVPKVPDTGITR